MRLGMDVVRNPGGEMKVFNTSTATGRILAMFRRKLSSKPSADPNADKLCLAVVPILQPLAKAIGDPAIQLFDPPFEYGGRRFATDATWIWPDGAADGILASFLFEEHGKGTQFILFDPQMGTIYENYALARMAGVTSGLSIAHFVLRTMSYCAGIGAGRRFSLP
jgi:hypothetical protein